MIQFIEDRAQGKRAAFFDRDWNRLPLTYGPPAIDHGVARPGNLDEMADLAERLADGFPYARADFYRLDDGRVYFGEMTFTSNGGYFDWSPQGADAELGDLLRLPQPTVFRR